MKEFSVITKNNCSKCVDLKSWLKEKGVKYEEWSVEDQKVVDKLLHNEQFIETFCDIEGCTVYTPVIQIDGKFYFKELFGINGLRKEFITKLLEL
jgi:glutaredoxin